MSMKKIYRCNICGDEIEKEKLNDSIGLHFSNLKTFTIGNYGCTDNIHICVGCAKQLKHELNNLDLEE